MTARLLIVCTLVFSFVAFGQDEKNITTTYKVPRTFLANLPIPGDPFAKDPKPVVTPLTSQGILENVGVRFPLAGGQVNFDQKSGELTVTTTVANHELVEAYVQSLFADAPKELELRFELYSLSQLQSIELMETLGESIDATELVEKLRTMADNGKDVQIVAAPATVCRSGQRSKIENGQAYAYVSGYQVREGKEYAVMDNVHSGTTFEVDPIIGADGMTLDINLSLKHSQGDLEIRKQTMVGPVTGKDLNFETVIVKQAQVTTSITLLDGQVALVGAVNSTEDKGKVLMLFLKGSLRKAI